MFTDKYSQNLFISLFISIDVFVFLSCERLFFSKNDDIYSRVVHVFCLLSDGFEPIYTKLLVNIIKNLKNS